MAAGRPLGLLHGLSVGVKDLEAVRGLRTTWGSLSAPRTTCPRQTRRWWRTSAARAPTSTPEPTRPSSAPAPTRAEPRLWRDRKPVRSAADVRRVVRRLGGRPGCRADAELAAAGLRRLAADTVRLLRHRGLQAVAQPGVVPAPDRAAGLVPWGGSRADGPHGRRCLCLFFRAQVSQASADPYSVTTLALPERLPTVSLAGVRAALSPDMGQCPVGKAIRRVFDDRAGRPRPRSCRAPRPTARLLGHPRRLRDPPRRSPSSPRTRSG